MATVRKYLFETEFSASGGSSRAGRSFSDADIAAAQARGRAEGLKEGLAQAAARNEAHAAEALARMTKLLEAATLHHAQIVAGVQRELLEVCAAICRKTIPALAERGAASEIERLVKECLDEAPGEARLVVRVPPALVEALDKRLAPLAAAHGGKLVLLGDENLAASDVNVMWPDGGAERSAATVWNEIDSAIARFLALPDEAAAAAMPADGTGPKGETDR